MIKIILSPLFFHKPASFDYHGSIDEGLSLLSTYVKRSALHAGLADSLVGEVTPTKVGIWHYFLNQNGAIPVFIGNFIFRDGKIKLEGEFRLHKGSKWAFILTIIGIIVFWAFIAARDINKASSLSDIAFFLLAPTISIIFIIVVQLYWWRLAMKDIKYIENKLKEILSNAGI